MRQNKPRNPPNPRDPRPPLNLDARPARQNLDVGDRQQRRQATRLKATRGACCITDSRPRR